MPRLFSKKRPALSPSKSFTLIELLLVIAVIGILASISILVLRGAVYKARDARIMIAINQARSLAEIINDEENSYANFCSSGKINTGHIKYGGELTIINNEIIDNGGVSACYSVDSQYCLYSSLNLSSFFCLDSSGKATIITSDPNINCNNNNHICS